MYTFGHNEKEDYACCRFLRANNFVIVNTLKMIDDAMVLQKDARAQNFYPDPKIALGVDEAVFKSLYPQVFCGRAKNNCPLFIMKPGAVDINALECVTTIDSMIKYQFHCMVHGDGDEYREAQKIDPNFNRYVTY